MLVLLDSCVAEFTADSTCMEFEPPIGRDPTEAEIDLSQRARVTEDKLVGEFNHSRRLSAAEASGSVSLRQSVLI